MSTAHVTRTPGRVDERTSLLDHEPEERARLMTLGLSFAWLEWEEHLIQVVDAPGSEGLAHERALALAGADAALVVVAGPDGVEFGTEQALQEASRQRGPTAVVVNKMDRAVDVQGVRTQLEQATGARVVPLQLPFFDDHGHFSGVVSLLQKKVLRYAVDGSGAYSVEPLPRELRPAVEAAWEHVMESVALTDDELLEQYLEYLEIPVEAVQAGLARALEARAIVPLLYASAHLCVGAHAVLDMIPWALPPASENTVEVRGQDGETELLEDSTFAAQLLAARIDVDGAMYQVLRVLSGKLPRDGRLCNGSTGEFGKLRKLYQIRGPRRTGAVNVNPGAIIATWDSLPGRPGDLFTGGERLERVDVTVPSRMASLMLTPRTPRDARGLEAALELLVATDAALRLSIDGLTRQFVLTGTTADHVERAVHFLDSRLEVAVDTQPPPVGYREIPATAVHGIVGVHRKGSEDDVIEFGEVHLSIRPGSPGDDVTVEFEDGVEEQVPARFHAAIERGIHTGCTVGPLAGYPATGFTVTCVGGEYDIFMSAPEHFEEAAIRTVRLALSAVEVKLLEPWSALEIDVPASEVGHVLNDIAAHRGRITGMEVRGPTATVRADCPDRELRNFVTRLQAATGGRGRYSAHHTSYGWLPTQFRKEAIDASPLRNQATRPDPGTPKPKAREAKPFARNERSSARGAKA